MQAAAKAIETPEEREAFDAIEARQAGNKPQAPAAPACQNCEALRAQILRLRLIVERSHHHPEDADAVAEIQLEGVTSLKLVGGQP